MTTGRCPKFKDDKFSSDVAMSIVNWYCHKYNIEIRGTFVSAVGRGSRKGKYIKIPNPTTAERFLVCLHEIAHVIKSGAARVYIAEYKCEIFALETAAKLGLSAKHTAKYELRAKGYVLMNIAKGYIRGLDLDNLRQDVVEWLGYKHWSAWRDCKVFVSAWTKGEVIINFYDKEDGGLSHTAKWAPKNTVQ